jgi:hypothetical protein
MYPGLWRFIWLRPPGFPWLLVRIVPLRNPEDAP